MPSLYSWSMERDFNLMSLCCAHNGQLSYKCFCYRQLLLDFGIGVASPTPTAGQTTTEMPVVNQHRVLLFCQLESTVINSSINYITITDSYCWILVSGWPPPHPLRARLPQKCLWLIRIESSCQLETTVINSSMNYVTITDNYCWIVVSGWPPPHPLRARLPRKCLWLISIESCYSANSRVCWTL